MIIRFHFEKMTKHFICFYFLLSFLIRRNETISIEVQQEILKSLISHLNIKYYILIKHYDFKVNTNILKSIKDLSMNNIYGSFYTLNYLNIYLKRDSYEFRELPILRPKTIIYHYQSDHLNETISTTLQVFSFSVFR